MQTVILIPARMTAQRLPGKPLADIAGKPMIVHVYERARKAGIGAVYVACCEQEVAQAVEGAGGHAVMTSPSHPSGTDRIAAALAQVPEGKNAQIVVNIQGDLPTLDPQMVRDVLLPFSDASVDMATLVSPITDAEEITNPNVVKAVVSLAEGRRQGRTLYFSRSPVPHGEGTLYHHIGIYAYRREALVRFTELAPAPLEIRERLEQLRALENGMRIEAVVVDRVLRGVDTPEDLEKARAILGQ